MPTEIGFFGKLLQVSFVDGKMQITVETAQVSLESFERLKNDIAIEDPSIQVKVNFPSVP